MRELIRAATCVVFDFDGPLCDLFHSRPAPAVAERLRHLVTSHRRPSEAGAAPGWLPETEDPYRILGAAVEGRGGGELVAVLEKTLTAEECEAAPRAYPTPYADRLIHTLRGTGRRLAIGTNNAPEAVECYLQTRGLAPLFAGHIHGRVHDDLRLKPDPFCLERALDSTATAAGDALMIGDAPRDFEAAKALGVPFLGYARDEAKAERLRAAGAEYVVESLAEVLLAVDPAARV